MGNAADGETRFPLPISSPAISNRGRTGPSHNRLERGPRASGGRSAALWYDRRQGDGVQGDGSPLSLPRA